MNYTGIYSEPRWLCVLFWVYYISQFTQNDEKYFDIFTVHRLFFTKSGIRVNMTGFVGIKRGVKKANRTAVLETPSPETEKQILLIHCNYKIYNYGEFFTLTAKLLNSLPTSRHCYHSWYLRVKIVCLSLHSITLIFLFTYLSPTLCLRLPRSHPLNYSSDIGFCCSLIINLRFVMSYILVPFLSNVIS